MTAPQRPSPLAYAKTMLMPRREVGSGLPRGFRLQEYVIEGRVGVGGFSIVYRARDTRLDRVVAVKEYIPAALATRGAGGEVVARTPRHQAHYDLGLKSFINEARLLASFDHPALVKVLRFWAENGSAYMAMPLYEGITLGKWFATLGATPSEFWLRHLAGQLIDALEVLHRERCYHRDVAPDTVLLLHDKSAASYLEQPPRPLLLDFGAARRVISDATQNLTAILKPGYSPVEQYSNDVKMKQGPWTDVYALSALLYTAVIGKVPPSAVARAVKDDLAPARVAASSRYSQPFLAAIDAGLTVLPQQRPQTMAELRQWFAATTAAPLPAAAAAPAPVEAPAPGWRSRLPRWLAPWFVRWFGG